MDGLKRSGQQNQTSTGWWFFALPLWKMMEFVSWDDEINSQYDGKVIIHSMVPNHQAVNVTVFFLIWFPWLFLTWCYLHPWSMEPWDHPDVFRLKGGCSPSFNAISQSIVESHLEAWRDQQAGGILDQHLNISTSMFHCFPWRNPIQKCTIQKLKISGDPEVTLGWALGSHLNLHCRFQSHVEIGSQQLSDEAWSLFWMDLRWSHRELFCYDFQWLHMVKRCETAVNMVKNINWQQISHTSTSSWSHSAHFSQGLLGGLRPVQTQSETCHPWWVERAWHSRGPAVAVAVAVMQ